MSAGSSTRRLDWILSPEPHPDEGAGRGLTVGVLALQGDFREHRAVLERLGAATREVRRPTSSSGSTGSSIPGGESTTMSKLMHAYELSGPIADFHRGGGALYGTCAGLIVLAAGTVEGFPPTLGLIDIVARRNAFGRQVRSFEADLQVPVVGHEPVRAVFIRAPWIESAGPGVEVLADLRGPRRRGPQGRVLVTAFHPSSPTIPVCTRCFLAMIRRASAADEPAGAAPPRAAGEPGRVAPAPVNC